MNRISVPKHEWDERLLQLLSSHAVYAPVENDISSDYIRLENGTLSQIVYNKPKPATPLKKFFLPVKENVTSAPGLKNPVVILGAPNCDVKALELLDRIYLDDAYPDTRYKDRRNNTTIVSTDCLSIQEHCHCTSYGIEPVGSEAADLSLVVVNDRAVLTVHSEKGESLVGTMGIPSTAEPEKRDLESIDNLHRDVIDRLGSQNSNLPDYERTGDLVSGAGEETWKKYSETCVSCGACSAICPTCSCFLLIDKPGFDKIRQLDTCQYPGFERVAGGEDALGKLPERFRNRYLCKYVWKPDQYALKACTGCGRCIETCIGQINKNEMFVELAT